MTRMRRILSRSAHALFDRPVQGVEKQETGNPTLPREFPIETVFFSKRFFSPNAVDFPVSYKGNVREEGDWLVGQFFIDRVLVWNFGSFLMTCQVKKFDLMCMDNYFSS